VGFIPGGDGCMCDGSAGFIPGGDDGCVKIQGI